MREEKIYFNYFSSKLPLHFLRSNAVADNARCFPRFVGAISAHTKEAGAQQAKPPHIAGRYCSQELRDEFLQKVIRLCSTERSAGIRATGAKRVARQAMKFKTYTNEETRKKIKGITKKWI